MELIRGSQSAFQLGLRLVAHCFQPAASKDGDDHTQRANTVLLIFLDCRSVKAPLTSRTKACDVGKTSQALRSEEHTSELQSHLNLVCRLLLEKKKNTYN